MKLSCGKRQSSVSAPIVCHRISVHNLSCCTRGPNERALIPLIWPSQNLLIVPYCIVPLLISLVLCVILSSENTSFFGDSLNCNRNEYLIKCTSLRPSVFFSLFTLKLLLNSVLHQGKGHKLASSVFVPFTLTTTLLLLTANSHSARAQMAFLNPDPMDSYEHEDEEDNEQTAYPTIKALVNGSVGLPCNISHTKEENSIKLILWYKNNVLGTPIYSIDARDTNISQARHFVAPPYRGRASFELNLASRLALLVVKPLLPGDDGHYICRVDFRWTRTTISNVKLDVIVPPQQLRVIQLHQWSIPMATTTGTSTITTNSSGVGSFAAKLPGSVATRQWDNGSEMHWRQQQHPAYLQTSVLSILHNGSMINEIETVRQPEETELTMYCDSIGARPRSMVKWYRLDQLESSQANSTARQLYSALHSTDEKALQLIDDSFHQVNQTELQSNPLATSNTHYNAVPIEAPVTNGEVSHAEMVRNELHLGIVQDTNHGQLYLCRTSNSNLSKPLDAIVRLEIYTRPKSIQIRQQMPSKDLLPPPNPSSASSSWSELQLGKSHPEDGHHFRNRTLHSISLLDYYLNANQPLMMQPLRLRSGFESELLCQSNGSRPAAKIVWLLRDYRTNVEKDITQLSSSYFNGHDTLSLLRFVPKFTDNRASIICRASNEALRQASAIQPTANNNTSPRNGHRSDHYADANKSQMTLLTSNLPFQLETSILLDVNYKPIVSMAILSGEQMYREVAQSKGRKEETKGKVPTIQPEPLQPKPECHRFVEMQEIFFNCSINANPQVHLVHWFFNGKALHTDLNKGLIITNSNRTMIVSSASKANAGYFHCSATNLLGETNSDRHQIDILYEPQCRVDYMQTWYHQLGDVVQLKCQVLANPVDNLQFDWQFNGTALVGHSEAQWLDANRSSVIDHTTVPIEEDNLVASEDRAKASRLAVSNDKSRRKANLPHSTRSTTHSSSQQQHLITNVVRIELRTWTSFGHFSCQASNQVGPQKEACKWHIVPHHYHLHHQDGSGEHLSGSQKESSQQKHQHRYHHRHHQQQSPSGQHHPHFANLASTLNNCQIIESSNAVVIKCLDATDQASESISQDFLAQIGNDAHQQPNPSTIDRVASAASPSISGELARVNHAEIPTRLTYHVQVFHLAETFTNSLNSTLQDKTDWNSKLPDTNGAEQHYFPQIDQPEPGKRVASKASTSSLPSAVTESALVMDTINFTNPLFIITNLSASTSYLLKIWSSKAHLGSVVEQVNITVRTRANDDNHGPYSTDQVRPDSMSATLATLLKMGSQKLVLLVALVALICILFVALTLTYAIFKIRAILDMRKARRAVNVNESISALETALCEMRPEQLENDLKSKSHFSMDTYRPYISVDNVTEDCVFMGEKAPSCTSTVKRQFADSSVITYPNYLYPSMTTGTVTHKSGLKLNCSDEESISTSNTSASNRSMLTNTTESTNANSNYATDCTKDRLELHFDKRCFAPPVTLESGPNLLFCMESDLAPSRSSHAFLVPEPYHSYPLQLHILPESNEDLECNLTQSVTMVSTPSADQCAYLPSMDTQNATITTVVDFPLPLATGTLGSEPETNGQKSIQTAV